MRTPGLGSGQPPHSRAPPDPGSLRTQHTWCSNSQAGGGWSGHPRLRIHEGVAMNWGGLYLGLYPSPFKFYVHGTILWIFLGGPQQGSDAHAS